VISFINVVSTYIIYSSHHNVLKREQSVGYRVPSKKGGSNDVPKSRSTTNSFYRANSTHNYLTRTIMLGGSHDGFNPKLGTPTRAQ